MGLEDTDEREGWMLRPFVFLLYAQRQQKPHTREQILYDAYEKECVGSCTDLNVQAPQKEKPGGEYSDIMS